MSIDEFGSLHNKVVIENGIVKVIETKVKKQIDLEDFVRSINSTSGISTPVLSPGVVMYVEGNNRRVAVIERAPGIYPIKYYFKNINSMYELNALSSDVYILNLALPWHYYFIVLGSAFTESVHLFFTKERIVSNTSELFIPWLPNVHPGMCNYCLGNGKSVSHVDASNKERPLRDILDNIMESVINSAYNRDIGVHIPPEVLKESKNTFVIVGSKGKIQSYAATKEDTDMIAWKAASKNNSYAALDWSFSTEGLTNTTVGTVIDKMIEGGSKL